ncbi:MAG: FkbM family methyltransferase [Sphingobacteriales bacterium]|nr:MAG: FkbM family methyltransferase [Sphingobacteriales bacterium]
MIFWGFYESAEMRLIPKYINPDLPVIELGASLGIVSSRAIACIKSSTSYICIEANPHLIPYIEENVKRHNPGKATVTIENLAIAYNGADSVHINITSNNTQGRINYQRDEASSSLKVKATNLQPYSSVDFTLICDIEGMEIEVIKHDQQALLNCRHLFIELHKTWYFEDMFGVEQLKDLILALGFHLIERDGNVFYFKKPAP